MQQQTITFDEISHVNIAFLLKFELFETLFKILYFKPRRLG